jgi:hypothetical protein
MLKPWLSYYPGGAIPPGGSSSPPLLPDPQWEIHRYHLIPSLSESVGNHYKSVADLYPGYQASVVQGRAVDIIVEEPTAFDSVGYDFSAARFLMPDPQVELTIPEGASFSGVWPVFSGGRLVFSGVTPPFVSAPFSVWLQAGCNLKCSGAGPMFSITDGAALYWINQSVFAELENAGYELFEMSGTSDLVLWAWSDIKAVGDIVRGVSSSAVSAALYGTGSTLSPSQSNLPNPISIALESNAEHLKYDPSWSGLSAVQTQAAIDEAQALTHRTISTSAAIAATDRNVGVAGLAGPIAPTLPSSAAVGSPGKIWGFWLDDEDGSASSTNTITPTPTGGDTIVGNVLSITGAFGGLYVYTSGDTVWHVR